MKIIAELLIMWHWSVQLTGFRVANQRELAPRALRQHVAFVMNVSQRLGVL
jgi:hypothetical protein